MLTKVRGSSNYFSGSCRYFPHLMIHSSAASAKYIRSCLNHEFSVTVAITGPTFLSSHFTSCLSTITSIINMLIMATAESHHGSRPSSSVFSSSICDTFSFGIGHPVHPSPCSLLPHLCYLLHPLFHHALPTRILSSGALSLPPPRNHPPPSNAFSAFSRSGQNFNLPRRVRCTPPPPVSFTTCPI